MKTTKFLLGVCLLLPILVSGQKSAGATRTIKGLVIDKQSGTIPVGTIILQYKTVNGAVVGPDGMFVMEVGKQDTVLIQMSSSRDRVNEYWRIFRPGKSDEGHFVITSREVQ